MRISSKSPMFKFGLGFLSKTLFRANQSIHFTRFLSKTGWSTTQADAKKKYPAIDFENRVVDKIPCELIFNSSHSKDHTIFYLHGGGFSFGCADTYRNFLSGLCLTVKKNIFLVDYRLAPEFPFPAALEDVLSAYKAFLNMYPNTKVILAGDSAGGGLALSLTRLVIEQGLRKPETLVLLSPWADLREKTEQEWASSEENIFTKDHIRKYAQYYVGSSSLENPSISPVLLDYQGFPPLYIQVGSEEILKSDAEKIKKAATEYGVKVEMDIFAHAPHGWQISMPFLEETANSNSKLTLYLNKFK